MSRNNKLHRKQKQLRQRRKEKLSRRNVTPRWVEVCDQAAAAMRRHKWQEARELLEEYDRAHPGQGEVLRLLIEVYLEQQDYGPFCKTCRRLAEKEPGLAVLQLMLAGGYCNYGRPASALRAFRSFVETWPDDPMIEGARESIAQLEPVVEKMLSESLLSGDDRLELAAMHEEVMACLAEGEDERAIRFGERLLARCPDFVPVMNNLSEVYSRIGKTDDAISMSRRVLERQPDNFHALSILTRHLFLNGRLDEAIALSAQLRSLQSDRDEVWCKKCEALSFLGDDEAVLAMFAEAERAGAAKSPSPANALLHHLAAVAAARRGDHRQAERYWRKALKFQPNLELARENLADAKKKIGERHGPWYFSIEYWIRKDIIGDLMHSLDGPEIRKNNEAVSRIVERFAKTHPEVIRLVPAWLDRGDEAARGFAWRLAMMLETPDMLDALRTFCLSQRGPDKMRLETAHFLHRLDAMPSSKVNLWMEGRWTEIQLFGYEITDEPNVNNRSQQVEDWAYEACEALRRGDGLEAERYIRKCIELEGEVPDLLNNLAMSYTLQGRTDDALALAKQVHERWPDYFFGRIAMANMAHDDGNYDLAESYLAPLHQQKKLHFTEFAALASATIRLMISQGNLDAARSWIDLWKQIDPDHPELLRMKRYFRSLSLMSNLRNFMSKRGRSKMIRDE